jgi:V8-like Glu-specific endopeptidase
MHVRRQFLFAVIIGVFAGAALAQGGGLRSLETGVEASPWEAVGRLDFGGRGFCTGALIAPDVVLTAAHCLFDKSSGARTDFTQIEFLAGWRNGRASAYRRIRQTAVHPEYEYGGTVSPERVRTDIALLKLDRPIRNTTVKPFKTALRPEPGAQVSVVSYGRSRSEAPALQEVCEVLAHQDGVMVTSCSVEYGSSGAPIFAFGPDGAEIVSVVSAMAEIDGEQVSLGTDLEAPLAGLQQTLEDSSGFFRKALPTVGEMSAEQSRPGLGAKFIRPEE